jgi:hypothetical protein
MKSVRTTVQMSKREAAAFVAAVSFQNGSVSNPMREEALACARRYRVSVAEFLHARLEWTPELEEEDGTR